MILKTAEVVAVVKVVEMVLVRLSIDTLEHSGMLSSPQYQRLGIQPASFLGR